MSNFNTISNQNNNIYPKPCVYNCGVQIFWNTVTSEDGGVYQEETYLS